MRAQLPRQGDRPHPSYVVGLHGTSRAEKEWPEPYWRWLGRWLSAHGLGLVLPWGNTAERERAERITRAVPSGYVLPKLDLDALAAVLIRAVAVVGVDTGLMHVAAALGCPGLALYSATDPARTGIIGALPATPIYMLAGAEALSTEAVGRRLQQLFERVRVRDNLNTQAKIGLS
jgi:heptosyltransferase-1